MGTNIRHTKKLILLDNTVLSNFAYVRRPDLITDTWHHCATTQQAWDELQTGIQANKFDAGVWSGLEQLQLTETELAFWHTLPKLGAGEGSCLAVAYHRQAIFATDDNKARKVGLHLGVEISGTLGFLLFAVTKQKVTLHEANNLLKIMLAAGYRSPVDDLGKMI
jgi:predicted nucleic acid-binding protein